LGDALGRLKKVRDLCRKFAKRTVYVMYPNLTLFHGNGKTHPNKNIRVAFFGLSVHDQCRATCFTLTLSTKTVLSLECIFAAVLCVEFFSAKKEIHVLQRLSSTIFCILPNSCMRVAAIMHAAIPSLFY
jgi:hypothetical protein